MFVSWSVLLIATVPAFAQNGAVAGSVVDATTKLPVSGVAVKLYRGDESVQSGASSELGQFRFAGLADGVYRIVIDHPDYLMLAADHAAARPFAISAAGLEVRVAAELVPLGEVAGRVLNPAREPVKGVPVGLRRLWGEQWTQIGITAEDGLFRFRRLEPVPWILGAIPSMRISLADPAKSPKPVPQPPDEDGHGMIWTTTFYPDTLDLTDAARIVVHPGAVLDGHTVKLRAVPARRLSGVVLDDEGKPAAKAGVALIDVANKGANSAMGVADAEGRFEFVTREGEWRVFAQWKRGEQTLKGYVGVRISRSDVMGVEARVSRPFPLRGAVNRDEPRDQDGKRKVTGIYLMPEGASGDVQESVFHEQDGGFVLKNVYPGRYRVLPVGYVPGYYVASIRYGDQEVTTQAIDIVNPPLPLKIVYNNGAGRATGSVDHGEDSWVILVPRDESLRDADQHIRSVKCGPGGRFAIDSLRPGAYYAFAFDRLRKEMLGDVEFVRNLASRAVRVEVRHGESVNLELDRLVWPDY